MLLNLTWIWFSWLIATTAAFMSGRGNLNASLPFYTHHTITSLALHRYNANFFSPEMVVGAQRGNYLRDVCLLFPLGNKHTPRWKRGIYASIANGMFDIQMNQLFAYPQFKFTAADIQAQGPQDHVDNPFRRNFTGQEVDPKTNMMLFIASLPEPSAEWHASLNSILNQLNDSMSFYRDHNLRSSLLALGQALHTLEDFYAHTNFMELAVMEVFRRNATLQMQWNPNGTWTLDDLVFPFVGNGTQMPCAGHALDICFPLTSGVISRQPRQLGIGLESIVEAMMAKHLTSFNSSNNALLKPFVQAMSDVQDEWVHEDSDVLDDPNLLLPSHAQLSKDSADQPLHEVAAQCAIEADISILDPVVKNYQAGTVDLVEIQRRLHVLMSHPFAIWLSPEFKCSQLVQLFVYTHPERIPFLSRERAMSATNRLVY